MRDLSRVWWPPSTIPTFTDDFTPSGNAELDKLLGGGLERGTNALLIGAAGVGKSSLALTYAIAAGRRGEQAVLFAFDEGRGTLQARARTIGLDIAAAPRIGPDPHPADRSCRDVAGRVRLHWCAAASRRTRRAIIVIDSLNGYLNAMPDGRFLILQMHELLSYLEPAGRAYHPGAGPARPGRADGYAARHQLSERRGDHAALFRSTAARCGARFRW